MVDPRTERMGRGRVEIDDEVAVPGTVRLMTDEPIVVTSLDEPVSLRARISELARRRPWVFPAGFLVLAAAYLALRRR